mgnify:CR=1 FL=1
MYLFLCDGKVEECSKTNCFKQGGPCCHTTNINHAKNFQRELLQGENMYTEKETFANKIKRICHPKLITEWMAGFRIRIQLHLLGRFSR